MSIPPISSESVIHPPSFSYREKMSWGITKENNDENLQLKSTVPGTYLHEGGFGDEEGGYLYFGYNCGIVFVTRWPKETDLDKIHFNAEFKVKAIDGELLAVIQGGRSQIEKLEYEDFNCIQFRRFVTINSDLLLDGEVSFILEADLKVEMKEAENSSPQKTDVFVNEIKSIFVDEETSDVLVIAEGKEFKCHKNILCARSEVFKNMLGHDTVESNRNEIMIEEISAEAVEAMLKYLYSGDIPNDPKNLNTELLQISDMHQLHPLVEACLNTLIENLDVASCISTFVLVDRYQPHNRGLRETVIMFMMCKAVEVVEGEECDKLVESHPNLAKELLRAIASESKEKHRCKFCVFCYN